MKPKTAEISDRETRLLEGLRDHPELMERFEAILGLTQSGDGVLRTADEIEELLVEEVRRLGNTTMHQWAKTAEQAVVTGLRDKHPKSRMVFIESNPCAGRWRGVDRETGA